MAPSHETNKLPLLLQSAPWIVAIIGWLVVSYQHNRREDRKETRAVVDSIKERLDQLEKDAYDYHAADSHSPEKARKIKLEIARLINEIEREELVNKKDFSSLRLLRQAITLNNFDTSNFVKQAPDSPLLDNISEQKDDVVVALESSFQLKYRTRFWQKVKLKK